MLEQINSKLDSLSTGVGVLGKKMDVVEQRLDSIDQKFDAIDQRFDEVDQKFEAIDRRFDQVDQKFDAVDQRLDVMDQKGDKRDEQIDALALQSVRLEGMILDNREFMEQFATKAEHQLVMNALDNILGYMKKRDEESTFMSHRIQKNTKDINKIKPLVGLS